MENCNCCKHELSLRLARGNDIYMTAVASIHDEASGANVAYDLSTASNVRVRLVSSYRHINGGEIAVSGATVSARFSGSATAVGRYGVEILFDDANGHGRIYEADLLEIVAENKDATVSEEPEVDGYAISLEVASRTLRIGQISGITDYNLLDNLPSIGGKTLKGDKDAHDLGLATVEDNAAKVDKVDGKGLSANDLTDERAAKVDKVTLDGSPNEYLNGEGGYSRPVRQGYGVTVDPDGTVHADPQVVARQSDVAAVAADLAAQKAKEQGDVDSLAGRIADEESGRAAAVAALQALIDTLNGDSNVDGSVKRTVSEAIAKVVAGAPEDLDTLKEIADYIASDKTGAAEMAAAISALQALTKDHTADIEANAAGVAENRAGVKANADDITALKRFADENQMLVGYDDETGEVYVGVGDWNTSFDSGEIDEETGEVRIGLEL